jgi:redox-sensitive bicupin YhaK (pirin superfamily)
VTSPVVAASRTLYLDIDLPASRTFELPPLEEELAVYPLGAGLLVDGTRVEPHAMAVLEAGSPSSVSSDAHTRFVVIGGEALAEPVHMWWNFVSTDRQRIAEAAARWEERKFPEIAGEKDLVRMPPFRRARP